MRIWRVKPLTSVCAAAVVSLLSVIAAVAVAGGVITKESGKSVSRVIARGSTGSQVFETVAWQDVVGAKATVKVPAGRQALVTARFSAESSCVGTGGKGGPYCAVRILIGGVQGHPASGENFAFDRSDAGNEGAFSLEGHAMERFRILGPGTHVVKVQATPLNGTGLSFRLSDWALVIQRSLK